MKRLTQWTAIGQAYSLKAEELPLAKQEGDDDMERLTYWNDKEKGSALPAQIDEDGNTVDLETICAKLAAYEDSGLTPEDISELQEMFCSGHKGESANLGMEKARFHARELANFYKERDKSIQNAKKILEENRYIVIKLSDAMKQAIHECAVMADAGQDKDCFGCPCNDCIVGISEG